MGPDRLDTHISDEGTGIESLLSIIDGRLLLLLVWTRYTEYTLTDINKEI